MAYILRKNYIETFGQAKMLCEGEYILRAIKPGVGVVREARFKNLLTDLGLDSLGTAPNFIRMQLGTGTTPPAFTDTVLDVYGVTVSAVSPSFSYSSGGSPDYAAQVAFTWTSSVGGATGNWTEIGISNQNASGNLRSRALILDSMGAPTTFPVLSDEQFQGTYIFRTYPPLVDNPASITLSGVSYDTVTRSLGVTTVNDNPGQWGPMLGASPEFSVSASPVLYTGGLVSITTGSPTGSTLPSTSISTAAYTSLNYYIDVSARWGSGGSLTGAQTVLLTLRGARFQISYSPTFNKLTTQEFIHNQRTSWARR